LNQNWREQGRMGLGMGVGVNHGEVIVGNIGSHERMDPTVIGDAVNLASRLEGLTRTYGVDILVGASTAELIRDEVHLRSVARVQVKGKTKPVDVFTLVCARGEETDPESLKWLETYEEALEKFRTRDFTNANTNNTRPTKPGTPSKSSRKSDFHFIGGIRAIHSFLFCALSVKNARERRAQEISFSRNLRNRDGRGGCRAEGARLQSHGVG